MRDLGLDLEKTGMLGLVCIAVALVAPMMSVRAAVGAQGYQSIA